MLPSQILKHSSPADLYLDLVLTFPELRRTSATPRRRHREDDPSFTALLRQISREANGHHIE